MCVCKFTKKPMASVRVFFFKNILFRGNITAAVVHEENDGFRNTGNVCIETCSVFASRRKSFAFL